MAKTINTSDEDRIVTKTINSSDKGDQNDKF